MKKLTLTLCLVLALLIAPTSSAYAESGMLYNTTPLDFVGMWIEVDGGTSGWASWEVSTSGSYDWSYDTQGKPWRPHVGIGGTPQNWLHNFTTPGWSSGDKTIEVIWDGTGKMVPQVVIY